MRRIASRRLSESRVRRFREAESHRYAFLIMDGNEGMISEEEDSPVYQKNIRASNFRKAVEKVFPFLNADTYELDEYLEYYSDFASVEDTGTTGQDLLDFLADKSDGPDFGDPELLGYAVDGKVEFLSEDAYYDYRKGNPRGVGLYEEVLNGKCVDSKLWESYFK